MSEAEKHPLTGHVSWVFFQPNINVHSSALLRDLKTEEEIKINITAYSDCREGLISDIRRTLQNRTTKFVKAGRRAWEGANKPTHSITLDDARCLGKGNTVLSVNEAFWKVCTTKDQVEEFLRVCDAIVGIPSLLLNPNRKPGEWWRTDPEKAVREKPRVIDWDARVIDWNGTDNAFLRHPALFASVTGLFRQAFWLCRAGFGKKVLESVDYSKVEKVLTEPTWKEGLELAEALKTWICVPVPQGGNTKNVSFPWYPRSAKQVSYWQRFIRLQRALHRHSADEVLGGDIFEGWDLLKKGTQYSGAFSFWGEAGGLQPAHKRVMALGKPKEKTDEAE